MAMNSVFITILMGFFLNGVLGFNTPNCFDSSIQPECKLGPYTPYQFIANYTSTPLNFGHCKEQRMFLYVRNGVDFFGYKNMTHWLDFPEHCDNMEKCRLFNNLKDWKPKGVEIDYIVNTNKLAMTALSRRILHRFPMLQSVRTVAPDEIKFLFDRDDYFEHSAEEFISVFSPLLLNSKHRELMPSEEEIQVQKFHTQCKRHELEVIKNKTVFEAVDEFQKSIFMKVTKGWASYLAAYNLTDGEISTIKTICAIQTIKKRIFLAWMEYLAEAADIDDDSKYYGMYVFDTIHDKIRDNYPETGPVKFDWCHFLQSGGLDVVDYLEDMKAWYQDGYGHEINSARACVVLKNMFNMLTNDSGHLSVLGYLNIAPEAMFSVLAALGIGYEKEMSTKTYSQLLNRNWRQSKINGLLSNLIFIRYDCGKLARYPGRGIVTMHQERIVNLKGCPKDVPCPVETLKKLFPVTSDTCDFDHVCSVDDKYKD